MEHLPTDLFSFFLFIGTPTFAAWVVSEFLENLNWFQSKDAQIKSGIVMMTHVVLGLASMVLTHNVPTEVIAQLDPTYAVIFQSIMAFVGSQYFHGKKHTGDLTF